MGESVEEATVDESRLILLVQAVGLKLSDPDVEEFVALGLQETNISSQGTIFLCVCEQQAATFGDYIYLHVVEDVTCIQVNPV